MVLGLVLVGVVKVIHVKKRWVGNQKFFNRCRNRKILEGVISGDGINRVVLVFHSYVTLRPS